MEHVKSGDTVKVHYSGRLDDGTIFSCSSDNKPIQFVIEKSGTVQGMKEAIIGMSVGQSKRIKIPAHKAFGMRIENAVKVVPKKQCPKDIELGQQLKMSSDNRTTIVKVIEISESTVTLDTNHPLAGKDITFDIKLVEIL